METEISHLDALQLRLSNERVRLQNAKTSKELALRTVWVKQLEKEIAAEAHFEPSPAMSDAELLAELNA